MATLAPLLLVVATTAACSVARDPVASYPPTDVTRLTVQSAALGRAMPVLVFRPRDFDPARPFALLYLFHGFGADQTVWFDGHGGDGVHADGIAQGLIDDGRICPVVIASAFIANSYGVDSQPASDQFDHGPYASYLAGDLLPAVETTLGYRGGATHRFVGGLSMGGFAALHLALTRPAQFAGVGALSPAAFVSTPKDRQWLFDGDPAANDPMLLATTADVPTWRAFLGNGDSDYGWVRDGARELGKRLSQRGLDVTPVVVPGGHDGGTWRQLAAPMLEELLAPPC
jgi:enterochelin esterase-like enzyme